MKYGQWLVYIDGQATRSESVGIPDQSRYEGKNHANTKGKNPE